jgi:uncharacterized membrane protein
MLKAVFATLSLSMLIVMGCSKETDPAKTPGAKTTPAAANTFELEIPTGATNVDKGATQTMTIGVDRGDDLKGAVALTFKPPEGITIEPASAEIPADKDEVEITVKAADDAAAGEKTIPVTGKVGEKETSGNIKVEVTE